MSGPPVQQLGATGPTTRRAVPRRSTQIELPRATASAPSRDQATLGDHHHCAPQPFGSRRLRPAGVHSTTPPCVVTYAARSPVGAQASQRVGSLARPTIVPPIEISRPSPLKA